MRVAIIGAGKVGSVLGRVLVENGHNVSCVVSRTRVSARRAGRFLSCRNFSTSLEAIPQQLDIILITTPHGAIEQVALNLSRRRDLDFAEIGVCHASGMLSANALEPVRRRGARVFSFHPLQTFPRDFHPRQILPSARGIYYGVDGSRRALVVARRLARALNGKVIEIPPAMRPFYHAACVVASNHLTAMLSILDLMFRRLHTQEADFFAVFQPIIMATLRNVERTSPEEALSGPIARGGTETVVEHLASIKKYAPEVMPYFLRMSLETVRLAAAKGSITPRQIRALRTLINSSIHSLSHCKKEAS